MDPGLVILPACDNCVPGDSSPYVAPLLVLAAAGLMLGAGLLLLTRGAAPRRRLHGIVAAVCLGVGLPGAVALTDLPVSAQGATCGGALSASLERGVPADSALDSIQAACKERGQAVIDQAVAIGVGALLVGAAFTLVAGVSASGSRRWREMAHDVQAHAG